MRAGSETTFVMILAIGYPLRHQNKQMTFSDWYMSWLRKPLKVR